MNRLALPMASDRPQSSSVSQGLSSSQRPFDGLRLQTCFHAVEDTFDNLRLELGFFRTQVQGLSADNQIRIRRKHRLLYNTFFAQTVLVLREIGDLPRSRYNCVFGLDFDSMQTWLDIEFGPTGKISLALRAWRPFFDFVLSMAATFGISPPQTGNEHPIFSKFSRGARDAWEIRCSALPICCWRADRIASVTPKLRLECGKLQTYPQKRALMGASRLEKCRAARALPIIGTAPGKNPINSAFP